ncbi:MAG: tetratricopeptide repeat protein [Thermoplasmata archaeon YP2-bin.285]|uniref:Tetratricopeptide repeat protein n=1 Tax=Candidatus Sysuiplasma superficiale TaxID=2823368 RepID=A0A8J8CB21_9ARCH|nr:tetratricopeptide repeat protein [Candidatus Sysuiplasma superficiale]
MSSTVSRHVQPEHEDRTGMFASLSFDDYSSICASIASALKVSVGGRELFDEIFIITGKRGGTDCTLLFPLPSVPIDVQRLNRAARKAKLRRQHVILLSPERLDTGALKLKGVDESVTGNAFTRIASSTARYRNIAMTGPATKGRGTAVDVQRRYRDAMMYARGRYDAGDFDEVLRALDLLSSMKPESEEVFRLRGLVFLREKRFEEALRQFEMAIKCNGASTDNWLGKASALYAMGDYSSEIECYNRVLSINPGHVRALQNRGVALQNMGRVNEAARDYEKALKYSPGNPDIMRNLALARYSMGMADDALSILEKILSAAPGDMAALRTRALIMAESGMNGATAALKEYLQKREDGAVMAVAASVFLKNGDIAEAERYARRALEIEPGNEIAVQVIGEIGKGSEPMTATPVAATFTAGDQIPSSEAASSGPSAGRYQEKLTAEEIEEAVRRDFPSPQEREGALVLLSNIRTNEAKYAFSRLMNGIESADITTEDLALAAERWAFSCGRYVFSRDISNRMMNGGGQEWRMRNISSLIKLRDYPAAHVIAAELQNPFRMTLEPALSMLLGRPGKAARLLRKKDRPSFPDRNNAGVLLMMEEYTKEACDHFNELRFRSYPASINRAVALCLRGDLSLAEEMLSQLHDSYLWQHHYNLGAMRFMRGQYGEALKEMERAAEMEGNTTTLTGLGKALMADGKLEEAKKQFLLALSVDSDCREAKSGLRKVTRELTKRKA